MAPARNVSAAAITTDRPEPRSMWATLASVVVLPVPFMPTNTTVHGLREPDILESKSTSAAPSNMDETAPTSEARIASCADFFSTTEPTSDARERSRMAEATSKDTSDWSNNISSSSSAASTSAGPSSRSPILLDTAENAPLSLSNISARLHLADQRVDLGARPVYLLPDLAQLPGRLVSGGGQFLGSRL